MANNYKMTNEDINMMLYFIEEKGDITRWSSYPEHKAEIAERYPDLVIALAEIDQGKKHLRWALRDIKDKLDE